MFSEAIKLAISTLLVARTNTLTSDPDLPSIKPNSPDSFWTILKTNHLSAAIPAALYTLATYLQSVGALNLDLLPYLMLSQAKVLITPVLGIFLLNQKFTLRHWACFAMISTGVILAQTAPTTAYSASASVATPNSQTQILGITAMLLSGLFVSLASIQIEKMLQTRKAFMARNAQLAAYSLLSATVVYFWHSLRVPAGSMGFLRAYTHFHVWVFIFLQVTGGFLVAWCVALSGTVVKNHAQVVGFLAALTVPMVVQGNVNLQVSLPWLGNRFTGLTGGSIGVV
ncbi:nucleotide-sugar transporter-domain-containing protein [Aspergillus karnatakaensis]|uniref:putative nucleotide-sugar transporter n=1 Tax=Aspergillus karnatakaensis TaxID=1810916 RepID=UPI003CCD8FA2